MSAPILARTGSRPRPDLVLAPGIALARGRVHELAGPARRTLAALLAGRTEGPVIWIALSWMPERLHPEGLQPFLDPGRLILVLPRRAEDLLWSMEETLRAGQVATVVADLTEPPGLTPIRRLQLAAEAGQEATGLAALGLVLTPGEGGAAGVETRWTIAPRHDAATDAWHLSRTRARAAPPADFRLAWTPAEGEETAGEERAGEGRAGGTLRLVPRPAPPPAEAPTSLPTPGAGDGMARGAAAPAPGAASPVPPRALGSPAAT